MVYSLSLSSPLPSRFNQLFHFLVVVGTLVLLAHPGTLPTYATLTSRSTQYRSVGILLTRKEDWNRRNHASSTRSTPRNDGSSLDVAAHWETALPGAASRLKGSDASDALRSATAEAAAQVSPFPLSQAPSRNQSLTLTPFLDALPIPAVLDVRRANSNGNAATRPDLVLGAYRTTWKFHRSLPATPVYAFGRSAASASVPGPTILAACNVPVVVKWVNAITDSKHLLPVDSTLGVPSLATSHVPFVPHLHGAHVHSTSDGHPNAWFTASGNKGPSFSSSTYTYPNAQAPATLWYHDHTVGMTRLNVEAGLFGAYLLTQSAVERRLNLPAGRWDVPLVLQDKSFTRDGAIRSPRAGQNPSVHPYWVPQGTGDYATVNGKVNPYFQVQPRKYLFRLINGNLARFLGLSLVSPSLVRHSFTVVASDAGYLPSPSTQTYLLLAPGERVSLVIDFSSFAAGSQLLLRNDARAPYPDGDLPGAGTQWVMQFRVARLTAGKDTSSIPKSLNPLPAANVKAAVNYPSGRAIVLSETRSAVTNKPTGFFLERKGWSDAATIKVKYGTSEIWNIINLTGNHHPIHVHFVPHRVISRQKFDVGGYDHGVCTLPGCLQGSPKYPSGHELGLKDTTVAPVGYVTTILLNFTLGYGSSQATAQFDPRTGPGYVIHCHILNHEDNDMMRPVKVV